jgi:hypothetical protein
MHNSEKIVLEALNASKELLSAAEYDEVFDLNDHVEWGLSIELLADILVEKEASLSSSQFQRIEIAFNLMNLGNSNRLIRLREHSREDTESA